MHEAALAQAALPAPTFILGLRLRPYSLGHELWLVRERNPIVTGEDCTAAQLIQAVLICCHTWRENQREGVDWLYGLKHLLLRRRLGNVHWDAELLAFVRYRAAGTSEFPVSGRRLPGAGPARHRPGSPFILRLYQFLIAQGLATAGEAWDFPFGLAVMHWQAYWESEDRLEIQNESDQAHDAFVAAEEAKASGEPKEEPCRA